MIYADFEVLAQALAPHVSKILTIDSSTGMVDLYNETLGRERGWRAYLDKPTRNERMASHFSNRVL